MPLDTPSPSNTPLSKDPFALAIEKICQKNLKSKTRRTIFRTVQESTPEESPPPHTPTSVIMSIANIKNPTIQCPQGTMPLAKFLLEAGKIPGALRLRFSLHKSFDGELREITVYFLVQKRTAEDGKDIYCLSYYPKISTDDDTVIFIENIHLRIDDSNGNKIDNDHLRTIAKQHFKLY